MEATEQEDLIADAGQFVAPPNGGMNELLNVGEEDNIQGQVRKLNCCFLDLIKESYTSYFLFALHVTLPLKFVNIYIFNYLTFI